MDLGAVIQSYGGPLLFLWAWLQGEAAVIVGGSLAAQGFWPWWTVWLVACVPAVVGHQFYFALGRRFGDPLVGRLPIGWHPAIARARGLVRDHASRVMLLMRFAYGIRLPLPILCGAVGIKPRRFLLYNAATAFVWAGLFTWIGYVYGTAARIAIGRVVHYESWALAGGITMGLLFQVLAPRLGRKLS